MENSPEPIFETPEKIDAMSIVGNTMYVASGKRVYSFDLPEPEVEKTLWQKLTGSK